MAKLEEVQGQVVAELMGPGGLFEMAPATVAHGPSYPQVLKRAPATLADYYSSTFGRFPENDYLVYEDERLTYKQCDEMTNAVAHSLEQSFGIRCGDRVSIAMRNYPEWCLSFIALTRMGAVAVPLNSLWKDAEYEYGLQDSGSKVLICDEERYSMAKAACEKLGIKVVLVRSSTRPSGVSRFQDLVEAGAGQRPQGASTLQTDDMAVIMYTSGTTGNPKGVVLTNRGMCQQMHMGEMGGALKAEVMKRMGMPADTKQKTVLCSVPLFHVTGLMHIFLASMAGGRKMVMMFKWDALKALQLIQREQVNLFTGVPTMIADMMEHPDFEKYDTSSVEVMGGGGGPTPKSQVGKTAEKFKGAAAGVFQGYGLTETNGAVCTNAGQAYLDRPTSIGKPNPTVEWQIRDMDERTKALPTNSVGELWIKTPLNMKEYFGKPEKTAEVLDADGWFASGDIAKLDEEGFCYILDRAKDIIIRGGENISCAEVEAAFIGTDLVLECAAFGLPDERLGEKVGLMYVPNARGREVNVTAKMLRDAVGGKVAAFKMPGEELMFRNDDKLPRGATEKIQKRDIRDAISAKLGLSQPRAKL